MGLGYLCKKFLQIEKLFTNNFMSLRKIGPISPFKGKIGLFFCWHGNCEYIFIRRKIGGVC